MSFDRPFRAMKSLAAPVAVTLVLLSPVAILLPARIQASQQGDVPDSPKADDSSKSDTLKIAATQTTGAAGKRCNDRSVQYRAEEHCDPEFRKGKRNREIRRRHFQPRAVPAAKGRPSVDGFATACRGQVGVGQARGDRRVRFFLDAGVTVRRRRNSPIQTGWRRNCIGNIRAPTSPCSIAASAAKTRPK